VVLEQQKPLDEALDRAFAPHRLEPRDRGFARLLVATTLRRLGQIDAVLAHFVDRPLPPRAIGARQILRLGAAQLLFLGTPAHAAVGATVALAEGASGAPFRGLVNAVLRRVAEQGPALLAAQDEARLNLPEWLWRTWRNAWGEEATRANVTAALQEAPLDLSTREDAAAWAARLSAELLPTGSLRLPAGTDVATLPGYAEGAWWVQDAAAALPARLLGNVAGQSVADLCAAPGGKTAQLAAADAEVIAVDRNRERLARVTENMQRLKLKARTATADATQWLPGAPVDAVLLDAPCSATGTVRRHPDLPHVKKPSDVASLAKLQRALLANAVRMLKPGGTLVYATCSLQPEEGEGQAVWAMLNLGLEPLPISAAELSVPENWLHDGWLRTQPGFWPERGGVDGFFAARFRKS
jgi:16S rRNA (cytosine967-C5)-methyltransferase